MTEQFLTAALDGDLARLMELLAPDVTLWNDTGGKIRAALHPIHGADKIARFTAAVAGPRFLGMVTVEYLDLNGEPGAVIFGDGEVIAAGLVGLRDGRISEIWMIRNPDKLRGLQVSPRPAGDGTK